LVAVLSLVTTVMGLQSFPMTPQANHVKGPTRATYGQEGPFGGARLARTAHVRGTLRADTQSSV
jgi:hypothetical protein